MSQMTLIGPKSREVGVELSWHNGLGVGVGLEGASVSSKLGASFGEMDFINGIIDLPEEEFLSEVGDDPHGQVGMALLCETCNWELSLWTWCELVLVRCWSPPPPALFVSLGFELDMLAWDCAGLLLPSICNV